MRADVPGPPLPLFPENPRLATPAMVEMMPAGDMSRTTEFDESAKAYDPAPSQAMPAATAGRASI